MHANYSYNLDHAHKSKVCLSKILVEHILPDTNGSCSECCVTIYAHLLFSQKYMRRYIGVLASPQDAQ
jgi:hypothetical protein